MYKNSFTFNLDFPYIFICTHTFYTCYHTFSVGANSALSKSNPLIIFILEFKYPGEGIP